MTAAHCECREAENLYDNAVESRICNIVSEVVGCVVESDDNLMGYGLDSLMAVDLANLLESTFRVSFPPHSFEEFPTVSSIVEYLETASKNEENVKIQRMLEPAKC